MKKFKYDSEGKVIPETKYYDNGKIKSKIFQRSNDSNEVCEIKYFSNGKESKVTHYYNGIVSYVYKYHKIYENNSTQIYYDKNGIPESRLELVITKTKSYHTKYNYKNGLQHGIVVKFGEKFYPREYWIEGVQIKNDKILINLMDLIYELDTEIYLLDKYLNDYDWSPHTKRVRKIHKFLENQLEIYIKSVKKHFETVDLEWFRR